MLVDIAPAKSAPAARNVADRACLLLDDVFIQEQNGFNRVWHQGRPSEPVIVADRPWERWTHLFGSVVYKPGEKVYGMWYEALDGTRPETLDSLILYAESTDGLKWTKPELGLKMIKGSKANNVVLEKAELPAVFIDPNAGDPASRMRMVAWDNSLGVPHGRLRVYRSGDGRAWNPLADAIPEFLVDPAERCPGVRCDTNVVMWDALAGRYLATYRTYPRHKSGFRDNRRRAVGVTTSSYLLTGWTPITTVLKADDEDDRRALAVRPGIKQAWSELYVMPVFVYGNHYIGLLSLLDFLDGSDTQPGGGDLQFAFSHDATAWHRPAPRQSIVPREPGGLVPVYAACGQPIVKGNELWLYYSEATSAHPAPGHKAQIRIAKFRVDGFASLNAADGVALLTTVPLTFKGGKLHVNFEVPASKELRVGLLDEKGAPLLGFESEACDPLSGDQTAQTVAWKGKSDLAPLKDKTLRLKITMTGGSLYSFRFG